MKSMETDAYRYLTEKGIKPSVQRLAIMEYLLENRTHPTVDEIYSALSPAIPTLSKTTVYNTLKLFSANGAVLCLDIDPKNSRFDGDVTPHGHFMCNGCGMIYDFPVDRTAPFESGLFSEKIITEVSIYVKGYCEKCAKDIHNTQS